jgi:hypothetical protein
MEVLCTEVLNEVRDGALTTALILDMLASEIIRYQECFLLYPWFTSIKQNFVVLTNN